MRGSVIVFQSTLLPAALITVGSCPVAGELMGSVCVGMNGLCGMTSWMAVACMAVASPWSRWGWSLRCDDGKIFRFKAYHCC